MVKMDLNYRGYGIKPSSSNSIVTFIKNDLTLIETTTDHNRYGPKKRVKLYWFGLGPDQQKWIYVPREYGFRKFGFLEYTYPHVVPIRVSFQGQLRPDQKKIVDQALRVLRNPKEGGGIINKTTGGGKTCIALNIIAQLGVRTIFIVNMVNEIEKTKKSIEKFLPGATVGLIQGSKWDVEADIVIAMIQTLSSRYPTYKYSDFYKFGLCIWDEVHSTSPGQEYSKILKKMQLRYRLGLTATLREDVFSRIYLEQIGPIIVKDKHVKIVPRIHFEKISTPFKIPFSRQGKMNYTKLITDLCKMESRNKKLVEIIIRFARGKPYCSTPTRRVLVFTHRLEHAKELAQMIKRENTTLRVGAYVGGMKKKDREWALAADIMVATYSIASQAFDHPILDTVIFATPRSVSRKKRGDGSMYMDTKAIEQSVGRILRQENPNEALVVDIVDLCGNSDQEYFRSQYYNRRQFYKRFGYVLN